MVQVVHTEEIVNWTPPIEKDGRRVMRRPLRAKKKRNKEYLTAQELGPLMGVTRQTIRNWITKGDISALHVGRNIKIPVSEALRILRYYGLPAPDWLKNLYKG